MSDKIDYLIVEWAESVIKDMHKSNFSSINVIEKILRDPGISTAGSRHKTHWWPSNRRVAMMSRAMHQIDPIAQICLVVKYGKMVNPDDGSIFSEKDLVQNSSLTTTEFRGLVKAAKAKIKSIIEGSK